MDQRLHMGCAKTGDTTADVPCVESRHVLQKQWNCLGHPAVYVGEKHLLRVIALTSLQSTKDELSVHIHREI